MEPSTITQAYLPSNQLVDLIRWRQWFVGQKGQRSLDRWGRHQPALLGWGDARIPSASPGLAEVHEFEAPVSSPRTDAMQAALVVLAQSGDPEAAVSLLVQLRPGLVRITRNLTECRCWPTIEAVEEVRATFFEIMTRHSLNRRPAKIAANLLLDTRQRLDRQLQSSRPRLQLVTNTYPDVDSHTSVLAYETLRSVAAGLPGSISSQRLTADLAFRAWVLKQSRVAIAEELGMKPQGVRSRLHRLRSAIRAEEEFGLSA